MVTLASTNQPTYGSTMQSVADLVPPTEEAAEEAPAPKAKAKKKPSLRRSKFSDLYPDDMALKVLVEENPKKVGSKAHAMFEGYFGCTTVGEARAKGVSYQSIAYDVARRFIQLG